MRMPDRNSAVIVGLTLAFILCLTAVFLNETSFSERVDYQIGTERPADRQASSYLVNVNTASTGELAELPGIGPELAERIVRYREENGTFQAAEDLLAVKGIGERKLEDVRSYIIFSEEERDEDTGRG